MYKERKDIVVAGGERQGREGYRGCYRRKWMWVGREGREGGIAQNGGVD